MNDTFREIEAPVTGGVLHCFDDGGGAAGSTRLDGRYTDLSPGYLDV